MLYREETTKKVLFLRINRYFYLNTHKLAYKTRDSYTKHTYFYCTIDINSIYQQETQEIFGPFLHYSKFSITKIQKNLRRFLERSIHPDDTYFFPKRIPRRLFLGPNPKWITSLWVLYRRKKNVKVHEKHFMF